MSIFLNSFYNITLIKNGKTHKRGDYPILFNSISKIELGIKTGEIVTMNVTLTPNFNDAILILRSGLLGIDMGSKEQQPEPLSSTGNTQGSIVDSTSISTGTPASPTISATGDSPLKDIMSGFTTIEIELSRPGELIKTKPFETKKYRGALTQPDVSIQGADVSITMKGYGYAHFAQGPTFSYKMEGNTVKDVISECLKLISYEFTIKKEHENIINEKLLKKVEDQSKTDTALNLFKWILNLHNLSYIDDLENNNTIIICDLGEAALKSQDPVYTFVQWRQVDSLNNVLPLLSFNMESARSLFLSGRSFGNRVLGTNESTKTPTDNETSKAKIDSDNEKVTSAGKETKQKKGDGKIIIGGLPAIETNASTEAIERSQHEVTTGASTFQRFNFEVLGVPNIQPLDHVNIAIGDILELTGVVLIRNINHVLDNNGWITSFEGTKIGNLSQKASIDLGLPYIPPKESTDTSKNPINI